MVYLWLDWKKIYLILKCNKNKSRIPFQHKNKRVCVCLYICYVFEVFVYNTIATQSTGIRFIIISSLLLLIIYVFNYIYDSDDTILVVGS